MLHQQFYLLGILALVGVAFVTIKMKWAKLSSMFSCTHNNSGTFRDYRASRIGVRVSL